jgi:DNA (cytosine-5)-methyltransferase 1
VRVGSLFSGIGGIDLGLERAGMQVVWQVEKDPYCQKVLKKHWPEVPCYGDIKEIDFTTLPAVDLICGGFPCQPVSCAGKRQGDKDERWLWPEFYRAICEASPRWVLVENVPGLLSVSDGLLFGGLLGDLARSGYDAEWDLLPAAAFGAPHLRFRLFLVAHAGSGSGIRGTFEQGREAEGRIAPRGDGENVPDAASPRCTSGKSRESRPVRDETRGKEFCGRDIHVANADGSLGNTQGTAGQEIFRPFGKQRFGRCGSGKPNAPNPQCHGLQGPIFQEQGEGETYLRRRLADSDWWLIEPDVGRVAHGVSKRMDRLKCLGNAVVPQVAEWIGRRIMEVDK